MSDLFRFLLDLWSAGWNWMLSWSWWELCMLIPGVLTVLFLAINVEVVVAAISGFVARTYAGYPDLLLNVHREDAYHFDHYQKTPFSMCWIWAQMITQKRRV